MTAVSVQPPILENGDQMGRREFHRRYSLRPDLQHVELIEGVVYMPMPISFEGHAEPQALMTGWLLYFASKHPDVRAGSPATLLLDDLNEPEPDAVLFRESKALLGEDGFIHGPPDLVVEIASTSVSRDLHQKLRAYERNGIREYIVWRVRDAAIDWFELVNDRYVHREPDSSGIIESGTFPRLRLDIQAALRRDLGAVLAAVR